MVTAFLALVYLVPVLILFGALTLIAEWLEGRE
jgi:hypothetical protein